MADDFTPGEIARTFTRQDDAIRATNDRVAELARETVSAKSYEIAHQALIDRVIHLEQDMLERLGRIEAAAGERHKSLGREIAGLKQLVEREVEDLREDIKTMQSQKQQEDAAREAAERSKRNESSSRLIAWIAAIAAVALVVVTVLQSGGH